MTTKEIISKYGKPNEKGTYLVTLKLPYPMRIAWDTKTTVTTLRCHKLVANNFKMFFDRVLDHYGIDKIKELGIDLFGGCFNFRKMTNANDWSTHSWGIAIDLDPERNLYKENHKTARFARPEYKPLIYIAYECGLVNLGVEYDFDWMHFQIKN